MMADRACERKKISDEVLDEPGRCRLEAGNGSKTPESGPPGTGSWPARGAFGTPAAWGPLRRRPGGAFIDPSAHRGTYMSPIAPFLGVGHRSPLPFNGSNCSNEGLTKR